MTRNATYTLATSDPLLLCRRVPTLHLPAQPPTGRLHPGALWPAPKGTPCCPLLRRIWAGQQKGWEGSSQLLSTQGRGLALGEAMCRGPASPRRQRGPAAPMSRPSSASGHPPRHLTRAILDVRPQQPADCSHTRPQPDRPRSRQAFPGCTQNCCRFQPRSWVVSLCSSKYLKGNPYWVS